MYKVILILDKFFLKDEEWEVGVGGGLSNCPPPQEKLPSKSPALLGLSKFRYSVLMDIPNYFWNFYSKTLRIFMSVPDICSACVPDSFSACVIGKFRSSRPEVLYTNKFSNNFADNFGKFSRKNQRWSPILVKFWNKDL